MRAPLLLLLLCALFAGAAIAAPPPVRAVRLTSSVNIDGVLDEAVWKGDQAVTEFHQRDPVEGANPTQRTEVRLAYDDDALYVGARCWDSRPDSILARLTRRDVSIPADRFSVYLDPYHDKRSGYYFLVNAAGCLFDGTLSNDGWEDGSWDGVWEAKAKVDDQGWVAEMRIPYSQLRFQPSDQYVWGVNFRRVIPRTNEEIFLVYQPKNESGFVSRWPELLGIEKIHPGRSIELLPYVTSKAEFLRHDTDDPFNDGSRYRPAGGADLRMGLGSKLTLNATVNPDFGQVEVDPAVVNLSDTESFFTEKRPFFVEGSSNFSFGQQGADDYWGFNWPQPTFFYTRRIGRNPQGAVPDADFADVPIGTTILGAAKIAGKLSPSVNVGMLHALTSQEQARLWAGGSRWNSEIEPLTYYGVARAQKEFPEGRRGIGFMGTLAERSFTDRALRDELNKQSVMAGLDGWTFLDKDKVWVISGWSGMSSVQGTPDRITSLQQSSRHYFQRPDAGHVEVDAGATSLTGFGSRYWLNKQKGKVIFNSALGFLTPSFDVNDVGFMSRADVINAHVGGGYKWTQPTKHRKYQDLLLSFFGSYDFQGNPVWAGVWGGGFTEFANNYSFEYKVAYNPQTVNTRRTRGGPVTYNSPGYELSTYFDTDGKAKLFYFVDAYSYTQESGSYNWNVNPGVEWKPVSNVTLRVGPSLERVSEDAQFVGSTDDAGATQTFGRRYVFARLRQTTVSAQIRLNCAFTPTMSLQLFAQPLISSGAYSDFKQLRRSRSYQFDPLGTGVPTFDPVADRVDLDGAGGDDPFNPDFNFKSLRGNAVFRWEYLPGSALFLVWTQERTDEEDTGNFEFGPSSRRLLDARADNIFLAKLSYYFNL